MRSLGLFRVLFGLVIVVDLLRRAPEFLLHYSNVGWLPNYVVLREPPSPHLFSAYFAASTPTQVWLLFALHLAAGCAFTLGYRTSIAHALVAVLSVSLNSRNVLLENGGMVVLNLLLVWTWFLPLGARFSWDAGMTAIAAPGVRRGQLRVVSLAAFALLMQWFVIYFFNTVHKNGDAWKDGTALYYFLQQDRMVTGLGAALRATLPLSWGKLLTWGALGLEAAIAILLVSPFAQNRARMLALLLGVLLHSSIAACVELGPFSWVMMAGFVALLPAGAWRGLQHRLGRCAPTTRWGRFLWANVRSESRCNHGPTSGRSRLGGPRKHLSQSCVGLLLFVAVWQLCIENQAVPAALKPTQPEWVRAIVMTPRMFQGWSMFAPNPPQEDGKLVAFARTVDGRSIDVLTGRAPDFDVQPATGFGMSQATGDFHRRLAEPRFAGYLHGVRDYLLRYPERTGHAADRLQYLELVYVSEIIPAPGTVRAPPRRQVLFQHDAAANAVLELLRRSK